METLLPSEIARLVLGYLEEEKCGEAAKCFLEASHHLNEYRIIARKGKKYPTKVNGYSLKEVLEEYCLVHSIVQETLSSMTDQQNVGGSMIDSLRSLVRACQPVQVHINLHPQQGQSMPNKSDYLDSGAGSTRPRSKKITQPQGLISTSQSQFSQTPADTSPAQRPNSNKAQFLLPHPAPLVMTNTNMSLEENRDINVQFSSFNQAGSVAHVDVSASHPEQHVPMQSNDIQDPFQGANGGAYQHSNPHVQMPVHSLTSRHTQQQLQVSTSNPNEAVMQSGTEFLIEPEPNQTNFTKPEETNRSFVTKCFGSSIVILDDNNTTETCMPSSGTPSSNLQDNADKMSQPRSKLPSPIKAHVDLEQLREKFMNNEDLVSKLAENINKVWTPAKQSDEVSSLGEGSQDLDTFVEAVGSSFLKEPCLDQFLQEFIDFTVNAAAEMSSADDELEDVIIDGVKKKKRVVKKKNGKPKQLGEDAAPQLGGEGSTSSKHPPAYAINTVSNIALGTTPSKVVLDGEIMTPMSKLLKSITSPSGDLYLDPTQFANLIDLPYTGSKNKEQMPLLGTSPPQLQRISGHDGTTGKVIQVAQPNGTTVNVPVVFCDSNQQVAQYVNEKGVNTICEIQVMPQTAPFVPVIPKLCPGVVVPAAVFGVPDVSQTNPVKKRATKRCLTRGGRQSAGQKRSDSKKSTTSEKDSEPNVSASVAQMPLDSLKSATSEINSSNMVTLYADGKEISSTISYSSSSDLPILVSDSPDEAARTQVSDRKGSVSDLGTSQDKQDHIAELESTAKPESIVKPDGASEPEGTAESESAAVSDGPTSISENKQDIVKKDEDCLPPLSSSIVRNTPGLNGASKHNEKRMSFSTPRRRISHIRALDFNTPPKESDHSMRRANTSPKNMSSNPLSPLTAAKSSLSSARDVLFKPPGNGSKRTSKVKAHLFKSPEYAMSLSSGFKNPTAVTSTPAEVSSSTRVNAIPPSPAWDKVTGVSLILDSDVSPVKPAEPPCKKNVMRSWDSDLRLLLGEAQPVPKPKPKPKPRPRPVSAGRKRKASASSQRRGAKRSKKSQGIEGAEPSKEEKFDESLDGLQDLERSDGGVVPLEEGQSEQNTSGKNQIEKQTLETINDAEGASEKFQGDKDATTRIDCGEENHDDDSHSLDVSNESDSAMAKMIECNLMSTSSEVPRSPLKKASPLKQVTKLSSPKLQEGNAVEDSRLHSVEANVLEEPSNVKKSCADEVVNSSDSTERATLEKLEKPLCSPEQSEIPGSDSTDSTHLNPVASIDEKTCQTDPVLKESTDVEQVAKEKINTPLTDPSIALATDKIQHSKVTWKESFSFETPLKDSILANMIPQTPRFLDPSCESKEDTPRTKIIKAMPFPNVLPSENCESPNLSVPPTPTIRNITPSVSPTVVYFRPEKALAVCPQVQQVQNSPSSKNDNLVNILIQECSRIEAGDSMKKCRSASSDSSERIVSLELPIGCDEQSRTCESVGETKEEINKSKELHASISGPVAADRGCARVREYGRKHRDQLNKMISDAYCRPAALSGDEDVCTVISPQKTPVVLNLITSDSTTDMSVSSPRSFVSNSSPRTSVSNSSLPVSNVGGAEIEAALDQIHGKKSSVKKPSKSSNQLMLTPEKIPVTPEVLILEEEQCAPTANTILTASNLDEDAKEEKNDTRKVSSPSQMNIKSCEEKPVAPALPEESEIITSDDESSDSSCSESSSSSDSDSSSSSSEGGTPVKENVTPSKHTSPSKPRTCLLDESKPEATVTEVLVGIGHAKPSNPDKEESDVLEVSKQIPDNSDVALRSVTETKDMGTCERIAKSRNAFDGRSSNLMTELELKRQRMVEHVKRGVPGRRSMKNAAVIPAASSGSTNQSECPMPHIVPSVKGAAENNGNKHTNEQASSKEIPKKRRSKSEIKKVVSEPEPKLKCTRVTGATKTLDDEDDEEFKLHLSGDEREEMSCRKSPEAIDLVEQQVAALHHEDTNSVKIGEKNVISSDHKAVGQGPEAKVVISKVVPNKVASYQAADMVLKTLLEKGFGCSLPPPPPEKIRKMAPNTAEPEKKLSKPPVESKVQKAPLGKKDGTLSKNISSRPFSQQTDEVSLECGVEDEAVEEAVNTSLPNALEFNMIYKGLGTIMPKRETCVAKSMKVTMFEGQPICLAPTKFFTFWDRAPKGMHTEVEACDPPSRRSISSRAEYSRTLKPDSNWRTSGENRVRGGWERNSGDRPSKHHDSRSRRNRSPSPRYRRDRVHYNDRTHPKDIHRSQDYHDHSRSDSYARRHEGHSDHGRRCSDTESKSAEPSTSKARLATKKEIEDGELSTSDSDLEIKSSTRRKRSISSSARSRLAQSGRSDRNLKEGQEVKKNTSSTPKGRSTSKSNSRSSVRHRIIEVSSPPRGRRSSYKCAKEKRPVPDSNEDDVDLDDDNFPVLGDDDSEKNDSKEADEKSSQYCSQGDSVTRRRAPPRSVNAHKMSTAGSITPVQKGKRRLSTSPDIAVEDGCQSSLNPEIKERGGSRRSKKPAVCLAGKSSKPDEVGDVADSTEILKNLDLESFLSKIHPGEDTQ